MRAGSISTFRPMLRSASRPIRNGLAAAYFEGVRRIGVNRISFGVQSFHESELRMLTRRHDTAGARAAFESARAAGFDNLNLDFMYGLPGQSLQQWAGTLDEAIACRPEHLSLRTHVV